MFTEMVHFVVRYCRYYIYTKRAKLSFEIIFLLGTPLILIIIHKCDKQDFCNFSTLALMFTELQNYAFKLATEVTVVAQCGPW